MKLVIIITHKENSKNLEEALVKEKFQFTKLETIGGFLRKKNITYLLGAKDNQVELVLKTIKKTCKTHEEIVGSPWFTTGQPGEVLIPNGQTKVKVGGATVFVVKTDKFIKV
jgi:uncharacterized protein YaaQ